MNGYRQIQGARFCLMLASDSNSTDHSQSALALAVCGTKHFDCACLADASMEMDPPADDDIQLQWIDRLIDAVEAIERDFRHRPVNAL